MRGIPQIVPKPEDVLDAHDAKSGCGPLSRDMVDELLSCALREAASSSGPVSSSLRWSDEEAEIVAKFVEDGEKVG